MKVQKLVACSSLIVVLIVAGSIALLPIRFPNAMIAWEPAFAFFSPAIALAGLLLLQSVLPTPIFRLLLIAGGVVSIGMALRGRMSSVILPLLLIALATLFIQRRRGPCEGELA